MCSGTKFSQLVFWTQYKFGLSTKCLISNQELKIGRKRSAEPLCSQSPFTQSLIHDTQTILDALLEVRVDVGLEKHQIPGHIVIDFHVGGDAAVLQGLG